MPHFCGHCGTQHDGRGGFCGHCGRPVQAAAPPHQPPAYQPPPPAYQPQPQGYPPQQPPGYPPQGYYPQQPVVPKVNPFIGWPISDFVRDGAALFCLFATLGMPWHIEAEYKGGEQWWVVIAVLLSVV